MERRNFIKGLLASVSAGTALVELAKPEQIVALQLNQPVMLTQPQPDIVELAMDELEAVVYIRRSGQFMPFGYITNLYMSRDVHEASNSFEGYVTYVPGLLRAGLSFTGPTL